MLLAAPFLASSVALAPAVAAQERAAEPGAVPMVSSCKLAPDGSAKPGSDTGYVLRLAGFPAKQSVQVDGPKTSFRATVNAKGELDRKGLRHGTYSVSYKVGQQSKRVTCATPPPQKPAGKQTVKITKLEVVVLTPAGTVIDCTKPTTAEFDGKITATGQGKVRYYWTYASSATPASPGTLDFNPRTTNHTLLHVVEVPGQANASKITTFVTLHLPDQKMSAQSAQVTFTCE
ncbi:hypothetical protein ACWGF3_00455 [Streptomyces xanthophaeus]|uniref:Secreted protein n=1 Tax=Streptomyces xanthophaeus TaxID=67385 RepID=A0A919GUY7_9ACTN|nr:hypothetical protein [Streptomyces xanthophaeus]GHI85051.1 hypothetical protein Sxan_24150 [Streptomyces xanthophaeus]